MPDSVCFCRDFGSSRGLPLRAARIWDKFGSFNEEVRLQHPGGGSSPQPEYPLQLRAFLPSQHGMIVGAAWRLDKFEQSASGENTRLVRDEVSITQDGYVCVRQLKSNFSE